MYFIYFQVSFLGDHQLRKVPGEAHEIKIQSSPYSHVGILAVDQSVYLLRNDKHLTSDMVMQIKLMQIACRETILIV